MMTLADEKKALRKAMAEKREAIHAAHKDEAPLRLLGHSFPLVPKAGGNVVSAFFPYQAEIDTRPLLGKLAGDGWTTALPIVVKPGQPLTFRRWYAGEPTVPGRWDIPIPPETSPTLEPDVLLVPLLAFDRHGQRLGYGGGFYDRTLAMLRAKKNVVAIGVGYAEQEIDAVPHDSLDEPLDFVMTERELLRTGTGPL